MQKVAIVTGAGSGIGRCSALKFAKEGIDLALVSRTSERLKQVACECEKFGVIATGLLSDVGDSRLVEKSVKATLEKFKKIDILVNNAGIGISQFVSEMSIEAWESVIRTNLTGTFLFSKYCLPIMIQRRNGTIVNISSIHGRKGYPKMSAYCASKFGIIGFTESLAEEVRNYGIRVNAVCPDAVNTNLIGETAQSIPKEMLIQPEEIAEVVFFLTTDAAKSINGQAFNIF